MRGKTILHARKPLPILSIALTLAAMAFGFAAGGAHAQTETIIGGAGVSYGGVIFDSAGNLYGTSQLGGSFTNCHLGCGTVVELSPTSSGGWNTTILYSFTGGTDGRFPGTGLIFDAAGNLYGTTQYGGTAGYGVVFKLAPNSGGGWTESVLHNFSGGRDGAYPNGLIFDASGNLYGATSEGGNLNDCERRGCGVVFELTRNSSGWKESVLHAFTGGNDGAVPGVPILDATGNLYGTTGGGGTSGRGTIFKLRHTSTGWQETVLYDFNAFPDGELPEAPLTMDAAGNLYGSTQSGGSDTSGMTFELSHAAGGVWTETVLYSFTGGKDGAVPSSVIFDGKGNLYGATAFGQPTGCQNIQGCGAVFKLSRASGGGWKVSAIYPLPSGWNASSGVVRDGAGKIYGTGNGPIETYYGGVYQVTP
jgi:uncharacterized repeat protein (TIGR03803 family)